MRMRAARAVRPRRVPAATVTVMAAAACLVGAVPAAAVEDTVVHCRTQNLQDAIDAAPSGATLRVAGTCVGNFTISKDLTVTGLKDAVLDGNQADTTVAVTGAVQVRLDKLTITNGNGNGNGFVGGGIYNGGGEVALTDSTVRDSDAGYFGGGIYNDTGGTVTLKSSTVRDNDGDNDGGGIENDGTVTLYDSTVSSNAANFGGGIRNTGGGKLQLVRSTLERNIASGTGGGIDNGGTLTLDHSRVRNNTANIWGGGIYNNTGTTTPKSSTVELNSANGGPGSGGGIYNTGGGTVALDHSTVRENHPDNCAGPDPVPGCTG
ncbi:hypothetical protein ACFV2U_54750 [Streptomyces sp. NPDC059697]|uniref:hypothetical protein n=1 Tax=Streptomyces sp. NPDC059697 TaxID=3346912 RepID=UPI0036AD7ED1